jgi:hypothetical protein
LYGVDLGGYISIAASSQDPVVKAVAVDSAFTDVRQVINHRLKTMVGSDSSFANSLVNSSLRARMTEITMQLYLMRREDHAPALESVASSTGRKWMFITSSESPFHDRMTRELFNAAKDPKELAEVPYSRLNRLYDKESSEYDARLVAFFQKAIPVTPNKLPVAQSK